MLKIYAFITLSFLSPFSSIALKGNCSLTLWVPEKHTAASLRWKPSSGIRNLALLVKHLLETVNLDNPASKNINNKTSLCCGHICLLTFLYKRPSPQTLSIFVTMSNRSLNWVNSYFNSCYRDWETALSIVHIRTAKKFPLILEQNFNIIKDFFMPIPSHNTPFVS